MCCCGASCARAIGMILAFVSFLACALSFIAPYWVHVGAGVSAGLWGECPRPLDINNLTATFTGCEWFHQADWAWEKALDDWQYAVQFFSGLGVVFLLLALFTGACSFRSDRLAYFTGVTVIFAALLQALGLGVWGYFIHDLYEVIPFVEGEVENTEWAYYVGVGGVLLGLISGSMFFCRSKGYDDNYEKC